jgi:hypothetical protein
MIRLFPGKEVMPQGDRIETVFHYSVSCRAKDSFSLSLYPAERTGPQAIHQSIQVRMVLQSLMRGEIAIRSSVALLEYLIESMKGGINWHGREQQS